MIESFDDSDQPSYVRAIVVDGWLIADAYWKQKCKPESEIAEGVSCNSDGDYAMSIFRVENPEWPFGDNLKWRTDSAGYKVDVNFGYWPLEKSRQTDAAFKAAGGAVPEPSSVKSVASAWRFGGQP